MGYFLDDPLGQAVATPFLGAFVLTLVLRFALGARLGRRLAVAAIAAAFLLAFALAEGVPAFPPAASGQKVFYIVLIGVLIGLVVDVAGATRSAGHVLAFMLPIAALGWLAQRQIASGPGAALVINLLLLFAASILVYWRIAASARGSDTPEGQAAGLFPPILVLAAAVALSLLALLGASARLSTLTASLAAASGGHLLAGYLLYLFRDKSLRFDAIGAFGVAGALLALAYVVLLFNEGTSRVALAILLLVFAFDFWARPVALRANRALRPVVYGIAVAIPAVAALAYAYLILGQRPGG